jgi:uncharacterized membrane protein (UPF0127 family)
MNRFFLLLSLVVMSLAGCNQPAPPASGLATVPMKIGSKTYTLEVAAKLSDRNKGLMYRDSMPADQGMIFIFTADEDRSFWMRNTRIPLDILYLNSAGKIVSIHRMEPHVEKGTKSKAPAKYAIELNAGEAKAAGVAEGDELRFPDAVKNAMPDP